MTIFQTHDSFYKQFNNQECKIIRELTAEERDPEVGTMYRIRFTDNTEIDCFADEIINS
jgi:hypothetical protein